MEVRRRSWQRPCVLCHSWLALFAGAVASRRGDERRTGRRRRRCSARCVGRCGRLSGGRLSLHENDLLLESALAVSCSDCGSVCVLLTPTLEDLCAVQSCVAVGWVIANRRHACGQGLGGGCVG